MYMQRTTSGAAGNGLHTAIKYIKRRREKRPERNDQVHCKLNAGVDNNWAKAHINTSLRRFLPTTPPFVVQRLL